MNRKVYAIAVALLALVFVACGDDDNDKIDEEWKAMNETAFSAAEASKEYTKLISQSENGYILWKKSNVLEEDLTETRITPAGKPESTDTVSVLYKGWYINKAGKQIVFDQTVNAQPTKFAVGGVVDGWTTVLQDMYKGEEREVVIPWVLGYGAYGNTSIPGYTTLYFNVKVKDIIQMKGRN